MATDAYWDSPVPKSPYPRGCHTCAQMELIIAVREAEADTRPYESADAWRDAYGLHIGLDHMPRQRETR